MHKHKTNDGSRPYGSNVGKVKHKATRKQHTQRKELPCNCHEKKENANEIVMYSAPVMYEHNREIADLLYIIDWFFIALLLVALMCFYILIRFIL